jgi:hypothetical protein
MMVRKKKEEEEEVEEEEEKMGHECIWGINEEGKERMLRGKEDGSALYLYI